jgi:hypothetical protein
MVMHRSAVVLLMAAALAAPALVGCSGGEYNPAVMGQGPDSAIARFVRGGEVSVVQVTVSDRRAVRGVELAGPGGQVVPAYSIDTNFDVTYQEPFFRPSIGMGGGGTFGGGYSTYGSGVAVTVPLGQATPAPGSQTVRTGQIQSTALIRLPDPQDYGKTWPEWKVRIQLGDPPDVSFVTLAAPQPLP